MDMIALGMRITFEMDINVRQCKQTVMNVLLCHGESGLADQSA